MCSVVNTVPGVECVCVCRSFPNKQLCGDDVQWLWPDVRIFHPIVLDSCFFNSFLQIPKKAFSKFRRTKGTGKRGSIGREPRTSLKGGEAGGWDLAVCTAASMRQMGKTHFD